MLDLIHEIGQSLGRNRTRTALTGLAVAWGIFMLVVLLGVARGVVNSFESNMSDQNFESLTVWGGITIYPYKGYEAGRRIVLRDSDVDPIITHNRHYVADALVSASVDTATVSTVHGTVSDGFTGVYPEEIKKENIVMSQGRFINTPDIAERRKVMVLPRRKAEQLFGSADKAIGSFVRSMGLAWKVVGVYDHRWKSTSYVPYTTSKMLTGNSPDVDQITVSGRNLSDRSDAEAFQDGVVTTLASLHSFDRSEGGSGAVWVWNRFESYLTGQTGMSIMLTAVWVIGVLTLLTGVVGISNIMFVSVRERTHEIGIRRAIGARPRSILVNVVTESIAITVLFGYVGIVLGMAVVKVVDYLVHNSDFMLNPGISILMAVEVTVVLVIAGSLAGLFPAIKAIGIRPVEALRDE